VHRPFPTLALVAIAVALGLGGASAFEAHDSSRFAGIASADEVARAYALGAYGVLAVALAGLVIQRVRGRWPFEPLTGTSPLDSPWAALVACAAVGVGIGLHRAAARAIDEAGPGPRPFAIVDDLLIQLFAVGCALVVARRHVLAYGGPSLVVIGAFAIESWKAPPWRPGMDPAEELLVGLAFFVLVNAIVGLVIFVRMIPFLGSLANVTSAPPPVPLRS
jgi:hypothetical protein